MRRKNSSEEDPASTRRHLDLAAIARSASSMILVLAAAGALISLVAIAPNLPKALAELERSFRKTRRVRLQQALRRLQKQRLVEIHEKDGATAIILTEAGKRRVLRFNLDHLKIKKPERWDEKWRIILFDIPERFKKGRQALHWKLRELGFFPLQKSVFAHPYPCRDEVDFTADFFGVGRYLNYLEATLIDDDKFLRAHFRL